MRNILITVMMLLVAAWIFQNVIADGSDGTRVRIEAKGREANDRIRALQP